jgi:hypothetical protein
VNDLAFFIDHKSRAIRDADLGDQHAVSGGYLTLREIAEQGEGGVDLGCKFFLGRSVIGTDSKYFCFVAFEFSDTSLVRQQFLGSTTGKRGWEEGYHDIILAAEIGEMDGPASGGRQREIRSHIANLQVSVRRRDALLGVRDGTK